MEEISKISENYTIKKNNKEYIISLKYYNSSVEIKASMKETSQAFSYIKNFTLDNLKILSNYFLLFKNISDIIPNIKNMLSNENSRDLEIKEKIINLILIPPIQNIDKIILGLPKRDINKDEIIEELIKANYDLTKRVENLEMEIKNIKEILEINNINKNSDNYYNNKIDSSILHNNKEIKFIIDCIGKKNLAFKKLFKMSEDGDRNEFHKKCDNKGPTLCLFKIKDKDIRYGGFTSVSWDTTSGEKRDENAFIFSINNKKMFKTTNYNRSIFCSSGYGPFFGGNQSVDFAELWFSEKNNCGFYNNKIYKDLNKECTQELKTFGLDELEVF